jgi:hypothetical protein
MLWFGPIRSRPHNRPSECKRRPWRSRPVIVEKPNKKMWGLGYPSVQVSYFSPYRLTRRGWKPALTAGCTDGDDYKAPTSDPQHKVFFLHHHSPEPLTHSHHADLQHNNARVAARDAHRASPRLRVVQGREPLDTTEQPRRLRRPGHWAGAHGCHQDRGGHGPALAACGLDTDLWNLG